MSGRDIIGIAKTGSGKTAAFLWPALVHIMDQPELELGDGPIALICAPTRELCQQIFVEARRFGKVYNINVVAVFGGGNKYEQSKALQEGAEIVVATPVRELCSLTVWMFMKVKNGVGRSQSGDRNPPNKLSTSLKGWVSSSSLKITTGCFRVPPRSRVLSSSS